MLHGLLSHPGSVRLLLDGPNAKVVSAALGWVALASAEHTADDDGFRWGLGRLQDGLATCVTSQGNQPGSRAD